MTEWVTNEFLIGLISIIIIDLVLAGDNAIVIGMAARKLPKAQQKKVVFYGTAGAIAIRAILTACAVWLLQIPGLLLAGGIMLIWIAYKLVTEESGHGNVQSGASMAAAIKTIVIADTVMGVDNVVAVAGAAHGNYVLVVIGLVVSIPIVVWCSSLILKLIDKYPSVIYIGSAVLALTAGKMIAGEKWFAPFFADHSVLKWSMIALIVTGVLAAGKMANRNKKKPLS